MHVALGGKQDLWPKVNTASFILISFSTAIWRRCCDGHRPSAETRGEEPAPVEPVQPPGSDTFLHWSHWRCAGLPVENAERRWAESPSRSPQRARFLFPCPISKPLVRFQSLAGLVAVQSSQSGLPASLSQVSQSSAKSRTTQTSRKTNECISLFLFTMLILVTGLAESCDDL